MPLAVSFDLDGTLSTPAFAEAVWDQAIPAALARKEGMTLTEARRLCRAAYAAEGDASIRWYQLPYWLEAFSLPELTSEDHIRASSQHICLFADVIPTLEALKAMGVPLIIFSNAARVFLDAEVKVAGLSPYFDTIISVTDDWGMVKAETHAYARLMALTGGCVHVGDHWCYDYEVPRRLGIEAYHIWRGTGKRAAESLRSLKDIVAIVKGR